MPSQVVGCGSSVAQVHITATASPSPQLTSLFSCWPAVTAKFPPARSSLSYLLCCRSLILLLVPESQPACSLCKPQEAACMGRLLLLLAGPSC